MSIRWWATAALVLAAASCADLPSNTRAPSRQHETASRQDETASAAAWGRKNLGKHGLTPERAARQGYREIVRTSSEAQNGVGDVTDVCYTKHSDAELARLSATKPPDKRLGSPDALNAELCARDIVTAESAFENGTDPARKARHLAANDDWNARNSSGFELTRAEYENKLLESARNAAEFLAVARSGDIDRIARARDQFNERRAQITKKYSDMKVAASQRLAAARQDSAPGGAPAPGADDGLPTLSCGDTRPKVAAYVKQPDVSASCSAYALALMLKACRATLISDGAKAADVDRSYNQSLDVAEKFLNGDRFRCEGWPSVRILRRNSPENPPRQGCSSDSPPGTCFR
jgi:hypothetical protein